MSQETKQPSVLYEKINNHTVVALNRPDKLNSLNEKMHQARALVHAKSGVYREIR